MNGIFVVGADCLAPASLGQNHFLTTNCTPARNDSSFFFKLVDLSYIMYLATSAEWMMSSGQWSWKCLCFALKYINHFIQKRENNISAGNSH